MYKVFYLTGGSGNFTNNDLYNAMPYHDAMVKAEEIQRMGFKVMVTIEGRPGFKNYFDFLLPGDAREYFRKQPHMQYVNKWTDADFAPTFIKYSDGPAFTISAPHRLTSGLYRAYVTKNSDGSLITTGESDHPAEAIMEARANLDLLMG